MRPDIIYERVAHLQSSTNAGLTGFTISSLSASPLVVAEVKSAVSRGGFILLKVKFGGRGGGWGNGRSVSPPATDYPLS